MTLEFKVENFIGVSCAHRMRAIAQEKFDEWLESQPVVRGVHYNSTGNPTCDRFSNINTRDDETHKARLCCVEELEGEG